MSISPTIEGPVTIVFPPPPPTTNSLTTQQRNQLLRKTKKLEQILGFAPHLLDTPCPETVVPVHISLPLGDKSRSGFGSHRTRASIDSCSSSSSSSSVSLSSPTAGSHRHPFLSSSSSSKPHSTLRKPNPAPRQPLPSPPSYETWSSSTPPFLHLSSSSSDEMKFLGLKGDAKHHRYSISPSIPKTAKEAAGGWNTMSLGSSRKVKMDRIRKKFGHDVPIELVFPNDSESESSDASSSSPVTPSPEAMAAYVFPARPRNKKAGTISGSRDSLTEEGIHHAPRTDRASPSDSKNPAGSKPVRRQLSTRSTASSTSEASKRLVVIVESPDEHGSGCSEDFGLGRSSPSRAGSVSREHELDAKAIKLWSTRRGYEGWAHPAQSDRRIGSW